MNSHYENSSTKDRESKRPLRMSQSIPDWLTAIVRPYRRPTALENGSRAIEKDVVSTLVPVVSQGGVIRRPRRWVESFV